MAYQATSAKTQRRKAIARIKKYRGNEGFSGVHEYEVQCQSCSQNIELNYGYPNPEQHNVTCGGCNENITVAFIRSNLSARFYNS
jgi:hypothetical protein